MFNVKDFYKSETVSLRLNAEEKIEFVPQYNI